MLLLYAHRFLMRKKCVDAAAAAAAVVVVAPPAAASTAAWCCAACAHARERALPTNSRHMQSSTIPLGNRLEKWHNDTLAVRNCNIAASPNLSNLVFEIRFLTHTQ